ncbi:expressed unknown protein [Seminavis robusta]|uniref:Uncharacterized protein n=1 Tax=Seminavis robusta TaxID=568900 RepID=A0A9N8EQD0_9STRA|nr:expressed unknown protein [Seminavis robusta]|eukprot:Sro1433_g272210.1 n/a (363) ;mRNA; r:9363-10451
MSGEKRLLEDCSLEELEQEMKRRRLQEANKNTVVVATCTTAAPSATPVGRKTAHDILKRNCFLEKEKRKTRGEYFPVHLAISLLRQHPMLVAKPFNGDSVFPYFLRAGAPLSVMQEVCSMWKAHAPTPSSSRYNGWLGSFNFSPNPIADFCLFGQGDTGVVRLLVEEFSSLFFECPDHDDYYPIELFLDRCGSRDVADDFEAEPSPAFPQAKQILESMLKHGPKSDTHSEYYDEFFVKALTDGFGKVWSPFMVKALVNLCGVDSLVFEEDDWTMGTLLSATTILSKLKTLRFIHGSMSMDVHVFIATLNHLHCCPNDLLLEDLELLIPAGFPEDQEGKNLMVAAVQSCRELKKPLSVPPHRL